MNPSSGEGRENPAIWSLYQHINLVMWLIHDSLLQVKKNQPTTLLAINSLQTVSGSFNHPTGLLFIFRSRYLFAIGLSSIFSFRWNAYHPLCAAIPNNATHNAHSVHSWFMKHHGTITLYGPAFQLIGFYNPNWFEVTDYNSLTMRGEISAWAFPSSLAVTKGILVSFFSSAY